MIANLSKAIAGFAGSILAAWVLHLTGVTIPDTAMEWVTAAGATAIAGLLGAFVVWASPKNKEA